MAHIMTEAMGEAEYAHPPRILVADDSRAQRMLIASPLRRAGFEVFEAGDGGEALDLESLAAFAPAVYLYDNYPGGIGLSRPLFERREELVSAASALISGCRCGPGCPACVGPILGTDELRSPKGSALRVLALLKHQSSAPMPTLVDATPATASRH